MKFKVGDEVVFIPENVVGSIYEKHSGKVGVIIEDSGSFFKVEKDGVIIAKGIIGERLRKATKLDKVLK